MPARRPNNLLKQLVGKTRGSFRGDFEIRHDVYGFGFAVFGELKRRSYKLGRFAVFRELSGRWRYKDFGFVVFGKLFGRTHEVSGV